MIARSNQPASSKTTQRRTKGRKWGRPARRVASNHPSELEIEGRRLPLSNLDKVLYPRVGFTKGDVIEYYIRIAPVILPHLRGRPLTLKRYPDGVEGGFFYEKRCPQHRPKWVETTAVWSEHHQADIHFCVVNNLATLVWAGNLADLELHTFLAKAPQMQRPTMMVFDLDPGAPANILDCCEIALWLKELLDQQKLTSFPKTSGSKGLQVYVPLNTSTSYDVTKPFAKHLAESLTQQHPQRVIAKMSKALRKGKVFVDWSQNDDHKTTVCAYSLRAKDRPTVSTPVTWEEVQRALERKDATHLTFESMPVLKRVEKVGDLFAPVLTLKQKLPKLVAADVRRL